MKMRLAGVRVLKLLAVCLLHRSPTAEAAQRPWSLGFDEEPIDTQFANHLSAVLNCSPRAYPPATVSWRYARHKESGLITTNTTLRYILPNGSLYFPSFPEEKFDPSIHEADYQCLAENAAGKVVSRTAKLRAVIVQDYEVYATDARVAAGNTALIRCVVPEAVSSYVRVDAWHQNEGDLQENGRYNVMPSRDLVISDAKSADEDQMFLCTAVNVLTGEKQLSNPAKVFLERADQRMAPQMTSRSHNVSVNVGNPAKLQCTAHGSGLQHAWTKDGDQVPVRDRFSKFAGGSLKIVRAQYDDAGRYLCTASNSLGSASVEINLSVRDPLEFRVRPVSQSIKKGDDAILGCVVAGRPISLPGAITWYKDGTPVTLDDRVTMSRRYNSDLRAWQFNLTVGKVENADFGTYQCFVDNGVEVIQSSASLIRGAVVPTISTIRQEITLNMNQALKLSCQASAIATPNIWWEFDGTPLASDGGYTIQQKIASAPNGKSAMNSTLTHRSLGVRYNGVYKCGACSVAGCSAKEIVVHVKGPPQITYISSTLNVKESGTANLHCVAKGYPAPKFTWTVDPDPRYKFYENGTFEISGLRKSDQLLYNCTAKNSHGEDVKVAQLNVMTPPKPTLTLSGELLAGAGSNPYLTCHVTSKIDFNVTWKKDGVVMGSSDQIAIRHIHMYSPKMSIVSFKKVDKTLAGNYTCVATSLEGSAEVSQDLTVYVPPRFTETPVDQRVLKTYTAHLTCKATAWPPPRIDWSRDSRKGSTPVHYSTRVEKMLNGTLVIRNVTKADEGLYFCTAESLVGTSVSNGVRLHVHAVPATINPAPTNQSGRVSTSVTARCVAFGNLPIIVRWYNGSSLLRNGSRVTMTTMPAKELYQVIARLRVDRLVLQDTKMYSCHVQNSFGWDRRAFKITAQDVPSPLSPPGLTSRGARFLEISWKEKFDGNSPITGFTVEYSRAGDLPVKNECGTVHRIKLTSLIPNSHYEIRIRATNALGSGDWSEPLPATTAEDAPSAAPENVSIEAKSSTEIIVKWKPPPKEKRNGRILGYFVVVNRANTPKTTNTTVAGSSNSFVIKGLKPWKEYNVVMQAFTAAGVGPKTKTIDPVKTLEDVPSKPPPMVRVLALSSTKIQVKWQRPSADSINGELRGYRIWYYKVSQPGNKAFKDVSSNTYLTDLTGLAKFTKYKISVSAFTRIGEGVAGRQVQVRTDEDVPGPPHNVRAVPVSKDVIRVLWEQPLEPNGIIREYTVNYSSDASWETENKALQVLGNNSFRELTLQANTVYYFKVKAKTSKGYGVASKVVKKKTEDTIPADIFDEELPAVFAKRSGSAVLNCDAYGDPEPNIRWKRNDRDLSDGRKYELLKNGSLRILQLQKADGGEYTCTATNILGTKTVTRTLKVQVPPSAPTNIEIRPLPSNSAVNITWVPGFDGNSEVLEFLLEFRTEQEDWAPVRVSPNQKYYIHDLKDGNVHYFRMLAKNGIGLGKRSKVYKIRRDPDFIVVKEVNPNEEVDVAERGTFYAHRAIFGTLIAVSVVVLVVAVLSFVAYRRGYIDFSKVGDWRKRIFGKSNGEQNGRGHDDQRGDGTSASAPTAESVCTSERLPTPDGSEISIAGSNPPLQFCYPILEEDLLSLPPSYHSVSRMRSSLMSRHGPPDDTNSDTSSEVSCGRYHRATVHPNEPAARRYMRSADYRDSVHRSVRSLSDASRVSSLGYRGHADGRSELDASSFSKSLELSNSELRYYAAGRPIKIQGQSHESIPPVYVRSAASMARDSGLGPEFGRSSCHSRRSSNASQVTYIGRPSPSPLRRDSASSRESASFPINGGKLSATRERKAYDSTSSECSSSRDELMAALEFGKRHNLDRYYGIPTLETTSASSEATNTSSDLEGVCRFSASPRLRGHGCLAPIPMRPPPFNPRSRSRGNENYMYVPRRISRDFVYGGAHNGSLV